MIQHDSLAQPLGLQQPPVGAAGWQLALKTAIRDPAELCRVLQLPATYRVAAERSSATFGLLVPRGYVARMRPADPHDPLLRQVLPLDAELESKEGFTPDPLGELVAMSAPGLLQKYAGRALMVVTGACAVHCRYCFRRYFPYEAAGTPHWQAALDALSAASDVEEVILSGGDPLVMGDERLAALAQRLAAIPHLRRLRLHTRLPIVIPERVCEPLINWLTGTRLVPIVVVHANHANELSEDVALALQRLVRAGVPVLNQSVLLRGVNDDLQSLAALCLRLVELRVMPYYLHLLDRVSGAAHFEVAQSRAIELVRELRARLPGYAVPRLVREVPGALSKVIVE
jgi:EF-P beta-lysylation protein EpmB